MRLGWRFAMVCVLWAATGGTARAVAAEGLPPGAHPLETTPVDRPFRDLLRDGYDIVTISEGLGGAVILIRREKSYVLCTLAATEDAETPKFFTKCEALTDG